MGKALIRGILPSCHITEIEGWLDDTTQACLALVFLGSSPMDYFPDIGMVLRKAEIGSVLTAEELLKVAAVLKVSGRFKDKIAEYPHADNIPRILDNAGQIHRQKALMDEIFRCIETEDKVSDYASSKLASIRRRIQRTNERIREKLNSIINSPQYQKFLQEPLVTVRSGRFVIPVKQESRGNVPGMVHDQSSSGATLFIEPMAVVEANNELRGLKVEEQREIEKILLDLTLMVQNHYDNIQKNLNILTKLDMIFAKASFSLAINGLRPKILDTPAINIKNGRHPLIEPDKVVPITISLGHRSKSLVITGPNTGGKTVTLKTAGLFVLMVQSGFHIPADHGSEMGIFQDVYADIGDEQSIEQSLSTFSSHMIHIADIVNKASDRSLVLFDELGAGTDPMEGAALAMAILDFLRGKDVLTIATTHYSELKVFATVKEGMVNASMEFDIETLKPTYHLVMGIPGKSNAFEISQRLGLREEIIESARGFISKESLRFEDVLSDMERNRIETIEERTKAKIYSEEIQKIRGRLAEREKQIRENEQKTLLKARQEARDILLDAKEKANTIIREMKTRAQQGQQIEQQKAVKEFKDQLHTAIAGVERSIEGLKIQPQDREEPLKDLKPGETVYISNLDQRGLVLGVTNQGDEVQVQVGIMKINVHISNIRRVDKEPQLKKVSTKKISTANRSIAMELDLRGQSLDEALMNADKYLDDVFLAGFKEVVLIHGKGTGVLRNGMHQHLKSHPHVKSFRLGKFGEGESGVTIVELK